MSICRTQCRATALVLGLATLAGAPALAQQAPAAGVQVVPGAAEPYRGHALVQVDRATPREALAIAQLTDDIWTHSARAGEPLVFRVTPEQRQRLEGLGIEHRVVVEDLQDAVDAERARIQAAVAGDGVEWYEEYKTYDEHKARAQGLAAASGGLVSFEIVGPSLEGREIFSVRIDEPAADPQRPVICIIGGQHAREWVSPMTSTWLVEHLSGADPRAARLREKFEIVIVPIMNPDGYEFTWDVERLWRKNRRDNGDGTFGVDLNRNWGHEWGGPGSSGQGSSQTYRGTGPFSEPELQVYVDYITPYLDRTQVLIDLHSYGQLILSPWSYTREPPAEIDEYNRLGAVMADAIASVHGASYTAGAGSTTLYLAAGASKDWGHVAAGAWSWTIEMRPIGSPGFELPPEAIIPNAEEITEAMLSLGEDLSAPLRIAAADPVVFPGEPTDYSFEVTDAAQVLDPASVRVFTRAAGEPAFEEIAAEPLSGSEFGAVLPATDCGSERQVYIVASSTTGEQVTFPAGAPGEVLSGVARATEITLDDDMEIDLGWTVGAPGDTATTGIWELADPEPTSAQPGDDHTPAPGVLCWVTDGRGGSAGDWDVDGGATTLTSYSFDASEPFDILNADAELSFWLWYSNDRGATPGTDYLPVLISNNGGVDWVEMERLEISTDGWEQRTYRIGDHVTPTGDMQVRIVARDDEPGSLVEAAVDDMQLSFRGCPRHPADFNRDGVLDFFDFLAFQSLFAAGDPLADLDGDGEFTFFDFLAFQTLFVS